MAQHKSWIEELWDMEMQRWEAWDEQDKWEVKEKIEIPLGIDEYMEQMEELLERGRHGQFEQKRNIKRDRKGRLNKGSALARKDTCNEVEIILRHASGMAVKEIVECMGCSKSTVYNAIKKYKNKDLQRGDSKG